MKSQKQWSSARLADLTRGRTGLDVLRQSFARAYDLTTQHAKCFDQWSWFLSFMTQPSGYVLIRRVI